MARSKKTDKYLSIYENFSVEDMKVLRTELDYAIKAVEREELKLAQEEEAKKLRDTLKIHDSVKFMVKKEVVSGEVITISVDKVQVLTADGLRKTVPYKKILK